jgi:DNA-binding transcriptional MocR family regulator
MTAGGAAELAGAIEAGVADGRLAPGQRLPSVRQLAQQVGLSPATVASALAELRRRGVVISEPRRGTRIGERPPLGSWRVSLPSQPGVRDLARGNPDPTLLPDLAHALAHTQLPARLYGETPALEELLALARGQLRADGIPDGEICIVSGALDGIERVLQAHTRPGDRIAVEDPGYAALFDLLRAHGLTLDPVAVDDRGMLPAQLRRALAGGARAAVITPRGQNPTGAALDSERARELRDVFEMFPAALAIEDDHLGAVAGCELHTTLGSSPRWAATRSVAKAYGPDLRLAVLAGDAQTVARVQGRQQCGPGWVSHILQALVLRLWSDPDVGERVSHARALYDHRRATLIARLGEHGVLAHGASGLNVWIPVAEESGPLAALLQRGWLVAPGAPYRLSDAQPAIRVTIATLSDPEIDALAGDIAAALTPTALSRSG